MAAAAGGRARSRPVGRSRSQPWALAVAAGLAVCACCYLGSGGEAEADAEAAGGGAGPALHVLAMLTRADRAPALRLKARTALRSLLLHGRPRGGAALHLHLVTDRPSTDLGLALLRDLLRGSALRHQDVLQSLSPCWAEAQEIRAVSLALSRPRLCGREQVLVLRVTVHDVNELTEKLFPIVEAMQKHFSAGSGTYYSDSIFFLSVAMHRIMPKEITHIVQIDLDLKFKANIQDLFDEFDNFPKGAVIGIAREMQPVYRHTFWQYRRENPQTKVGDPPPDGLPGFNSGVLLLNLEAMRQSKLYNQLLEPATVQKLTEKYHFKGHLGDQDFFTMVGMEHLELFHVLDCTWNRQLCTWWRDHGYSDVFDQYFQCEGEVKIYHGNCNTPIPED